jgi:hypothetical protein
MRNYFAAAAVGFIIGAPIAQAETIWAIDQHNVLFSFDSANPATVLTAKLLLVGQQNIVAIDFRPATGVLYAMTDEGYLVEVDTRPSQGNAWPTYSFQGPGITNLNGTSFGFDFDPVADRIRVTSDTDVNFSHVYGGSTIAQTPLTAPYGNPSVVGSAYSNNFPGAQSTTLYNIDSGADVLTVQHSPASGAQTVIGALEQSISSEELGFDIASSNGIGYVAANLDGQHNSRLFTINLNTGLLSAPIGFIGNGTLVRDIAVVVPEPAAGLAVLAGAFRRRRPQER